MYVSFLKNDFFCMCITLQCSAVTPDGFLKAGILVVMSQPGAHVFIEQ